jgi:hypothetical protein
MPPIWPDFTDFDDIRSMDPTTHRRRLFPRDRLAADAARMLGPS